MTAPILSIDTQHEDMIVRAACCLCVLSMCAYMGGVLTTICSLYLSVCDQQHDAQLDYYGKRLATCSSDRTIKVYDVTGEVQNNEQLLTGYVLLRTRVYM